MAATKWVQERWHTLIPTLEQLTDEAEIQAWRERPGMKQESSLRVPMTDTRNRLKQLPITENTGWVNPKSGEREHIALKYMAFSEQEWVAMNAGSEATLTKRLSQQQLIDDPEAIVRKAAELLQSTRWEDLAVGISVTTGRRLTEVLKTGEFHPKTTYSVLFGGQLKRQDKPLPPFEIPTLVAAELALPAVERLRAEIDCRELDNREVNRRYGPPVGFAANYHFRDLVPTRPGKEDLYTHLFRAVYVRIATFFYCPPQVADALFMPTIQGHYKLLESESETERRNFASTAHYDDYKIGDGKGNIDGRQGIKLGEPGVEVLEVFRPAVEPAPLPESHRKKKEESKTGFSAIRPRVETRDRFDAAATQLRTRNHDETLSALLDAYEQRSEQLAINDPLRVLAQWGVSSEVLEALRQTGQAAQARAFVVEALEQRYRHRQSMTRRYQTYDFTTVPTSKLSDIKHPEALNERVRRAIAAMVAYNRAVSEPQLRWYINQRCIHQLVGGRPSSIGEYLAAHQADIDGYNAEFQLAPAFNRKPVPINGVITVPEEPEAFQERAEPATTQDESHETGESAERSEAHQGEPEAEEAVTAANEVF